MTDIHEGEASVELNSLKRPRPVISCLECRRKKLKCDRLLPCQQCVKGNRPGTCSYQEGQLPERRDLSLPVAERPAKRARRAGDAPVNGNPSDRQRLSRSLPQQRVQDGNGIIERLEQRLAHLESLAGISKPITVDDHESSEKVNGEDPQPLRRTSLSHQFMPSAVFPDAARFIRSFSCDNPEDIRIKHVATDLRHMYVVLKQHHRRPPPVQHLDHSQIVQLIPSQQICKMLAELYFDNLEHCFRILHRPTFYRKLSHFFEDAASATSRSFLPQLVSVLSIAATLGVSHECVELMEKDDGELIHTSVDYITVYLANLKSRDRFLIEALQTRQMLLLLRWMRLDKLRDLWELSGQIVRQAMMMGLDRDLDDSPGRYNLFEAEMRRRLWMSVVEQDMMLSILCNMPCMIPEFTCRVPLNIDDSELDEDTSSRPETRPFDEWTDCVCQCILAQSVTQRLHACQDLWSNPRIHYDHILEHTRCFEKVLQTLPRPLRFTYENDNPRKAAARLMARMELDISIRRPLMHLYSAFAHANDHMDTYSEARAGLLQSCLMLTSYQDLFDPKFNTDMPVDRPQGYWDFFYNIYRHEINQAVLGLCLEVKRLSGSSDPNLSIQTASLPFKMPAYNRSKIIHAVKDTLEPMTRRVSHWGSDLKGLAFLTIVFGSVRNGWSDTNAIIEVLKELVSACKLQLERDGIPLAISSDPLQNFAFTPFSGETWTTFALFPTELDTADDLIFGFS